MKQHRIFVSLDLNSQNWNSNRTRFSLGHSLGKRESGENETFREDMYTFAFIVELYIILFIYIYVSTYLLQTQEQNL